MFKEPAIKSSRDGLFGPAKGLPVNKLVGLWVHSGLLCPVEGQVGGGEILVECFDVNSREDFASVGDLNSRSGQRLVGPGCVLASSQVLFGFGVHLIIEDCPAIHDFPFFLHVTFNFVPGYFNWQSFQPVKDVQK